MRLIIDEISSSVEFWETERLYNYDFILLLPNSSLDLNEVIKNAFNKKIGNRKGLILEGCSAEKVLKLYELYEFTNKVIIGSLTKPYGRKLENLLKYEETYIETLIDDVILGDM